MDAVINIIFVDNKYIKKLNSKFLHRNRPTDVISFTYKRNKRFVISDKRFANHGDVFISAERAKEQAREYDHSVKIFPELALSYLRKWGTLNEDIHVVIQFRNANERNRCL